jgi:hypothetical protein
MVLPRSCTRLPLICGALALAATLALTLAPAEASAAPAVDRYTPLLQSLMSKPRWFKDGEGRTRIAYELKLTNGFQFRSP